MQAPYQDPPSEAEATTNKQLDAPGETTSSQLVEQSSTQKFNNLDELQSVLESDDQKVDRLIAEESEKLLKNQSDIEAREAMKLLVQKQMMSSSLPNGHLSEDQKRAIGLEMQLNLEQIMENMNEESINQSILDSSINPSTYNQSTTSNRKMAAAQFAEQQYKISKKLKTTLQTQATGPSREGRHRDASATRTTEKKTKSQSRNKSKSPQTQKLRYGQKGSEPQQMGSQPNLKNTPQLHNLKENSPTQLVISTSGVATAPGKLEEVKSPSKKQMKPKVVHTTEKAPSSMMEQPPKTLQNTPTLQKNEVNAQAARNQQRETSQKRNPDPSDIEMTSFLSPTVTDTFEHADWILHTGAEDGIPQLPASAQAQSHSQQPGDIMTRYLQEQEKKHKERQQLQEKIDTADLSEVLKAEEKSRTGKSQQTTQAKKGEGGIEPVTIFPKKAPTQKKGDLSDESKLRAQDPTALLETVANFDHQKKLQDPEKQPTSQPSQGASAQISKRTTRIPGPTVGLNTAVGQTSAPRALESSQANTPALRTKEATSIQTGEGKSHSKSKSTTVQMKTPLKQASQIVSETVSSPQAQLQQQQSLPPAAVVTQKQISSPSGGGPQAPSGGKLANSKTIQNKKHEHFINEGDLKAIAQVIDFNKNQEEPERGFTITEVAGAADQQQPPEVPLNPSSQQKPKALQKQGTASASGSEGVQKRFGNSGKTLQEPEPRQPKHQTPQSQTGTRKKKTQRGVSQEKPHAKIRSAEDDFTNLAQKQAELVRAVTPSSEQTGADMKRNRITGNHSSEHNRIDSTNEQRGRKLKSIVVHGTSAAAAPQSMENRIQRTTSMQRSGSQSGQIPAMRNQQTYEGTDEEGRVEPTKSSNFFQKDSAGSANNETQVQKPAVQNPPAVRQAMKKDSDHRQSEVPNDSGAPSQGATAQLQNNQTSSDLQQQLQQPNNQRPRTQGQNGLKSRAMFRDRFAPPTHGLEFDEFSNQPGQDKAFSIGGSVNRMYFGPMNPGKLEDQFEFDHDEDQLVQSWRGQFNQNLDQINRSFGSSMDPGSQARNPGLPPIANSTYQVGNMAPVTKSAKGSRQDQQQILPINSMEFIISQQQMNNKATKARMEMFGKKNKVVDYPGGALNSSKVFASKDGLLAQNSNLHLQEGSIHSGMLGRGFSKKSQISQRSLVQADRQVVSPSQGNKNTFSQAKDQMKLVQAKKQHDEHRRKMEIVKKQMAENKKQKQIKFKKLSLRQRLPPEILLKIIQNLTLKESLYFTCLSKYVRATVIFNPEFEGQWVIKSFSSLLSKSGYHGIRNNNLRRIDIHQRPMHFQAQSLKQDCYDEQWSVFGTWWYLAFFLLCIVLPVLLVVNEEQELELPAMILMLPTTIAWIALFITYFVIKGVIQKYFFQVQGLDALPQYKSLINYGQPKGRNTLHCKQYDKESFKARFLLGIIACALSLYLGVFLKIYIFSVIMEMGWLDGTIFEDIEFRWIHASIVSYLPVFFLYVKELLWEFCKGYNNFKIREGMLRTFMKMSLNSF